MPSDKLKKNPKMIEDGSVTKKSKMSKKTGHDSEANKFKNYLFEVLHQVHPDLSISTKAMSISNTMMNDIFSKIAIESRTLTRYSKIDTLTPETIQAATKLNLPGELGKHAISEGRKAVMKSGIEAKKSRGRSF